MPARFGTLRRSLGINLMGYQALGVTADELGLTKDLPRDEKGELTPAGRTRKQQLITSLSSCLEINTLEKSDFLDLIEVGHDLPPGPGHQDRGPPAGNGGPGWLSLPQCS